MLIILKTADQEKKQKVVVRLYRRWITDDFGISERVSQLVRTMGLVKDWAYLTIQWIEGTPRKHQDFALPGRKGVMLDMMIDAMESPIKYPKGNKSTSILRRLAN